MKQKLHLATALGAMKIILNKTHIEAAKSLGCTDKEWGILTGTTPWTGKDRTTVKRLLDQVIYGMLDSMSLARFPVPAEYIAAVVTGFVGRCNYFASASWLENAYLAEDLGNYDGSVTGEMERVSASQLFALIIALESNEEIDAIAQQFARKCDIQIGFLPNGGNSEGQK